MNGSERILGRFRRARNIKINPEDIIDPVEDEAPLEVSAKEEVVRRINLEEQKRVILDNIRKRGKINYVELMELPGVLASRIVMEYREKNRGYCVTPVARQDNRDKRLKLDIFAMKVQEQLLRDPERVQELVRQRSDGSRLRGKRWRELSMEVQLGLVHDYLKIDGNIDEIRLSLAKDAFDLKKEQDQARNDPTKFDLAGLL